MLTTDASQRIGDSDKYFVFVDDVVKIASAVVTDRSIPEKLLSVLLRQGLGKAELSHYIVTVGGDCARGHRMPPMGFVPVSASMAAVGPVCYITGDVAEQYELTSAMMGQLWIRIQSVTTELLSMCLVFEMLTAHFAPSATLHCFIKLGVSPLSICLKWMVTGFAELLEPNETLALWDIMIAYHAKQNFGLGTASPFWILAAAAAAIFTLRGPLVVQCSTTDQLQRIFDDGVKLRPVPLLQQLLFLQ
jgi:hypothetical protein